MNLMVFGMALPWLLLGFGGWLGFQLVRQNGRILLRLENLEEQLEQMADALTAKEGRHAARNGHRPLSESRLNREGLPKGTPAPDFRLPRLDGGELSLSEYRGKKVLLVFSDPHCGPCDALMPELQKALGTSPPAPTGFPLRGVVLRKERGAGSDNDSDVQVLMVSRGEVGENRKKVKQHRLTFPIVLQRRWEISKLYAMFATPVGYLMDEEGVIAAEVAVGAEAILALLSGVGTARKEVSVS